MSTRTGKYAALGYAMTTRSRYSNSRMFDKVTRTWNPVTGCCHECVYCWARRLATARLCKVFPEYYDPEFRPRLVKKRLHEKFSPGEFVFVCDMGDLFCSAVPDEWIIEVLRIIARNRQATFLLLTKNPSRYISLVDLLMGMDNVLLGTTIETNNTRLYLQHRISKAPTPDARITAMLHLRMIGFRNFFISIEPIIDFDLRVLAEHLLKIEPAVVYVGYDNYSILKKLGVPEPPLHKTLELIDILRQHGIEVRTKTLRKAWNE